MLGDASRNAPAFLNILSLNIRSLPRHGGELLNLLNVFGTHFHVIVLSEIGARNLSVVQHLIPNYTFYYTIPESNNFGGVGMFLSDELLDISIIDEYTIMKTCRCIRCDFESLFVTFTYNNATYTVGGIYRHPNGNVHHFVTDLEHSILKLNKNNHCILAGDTNINILNYEGATELEYLTTLLSHKFLPQITLPSRITNHSATCIDHIFVRMSGSDHKYAKCLSGLLYADISDHLPCFLSIDTGVMSKLTRPMTRIFGEKNCKYFVEQMSNFDWDTIYRHDCNWYDKFVLEIKVIYEKSFPLVRLSRKRSHDKPWITSGLKTSISHNHRLYRKSLHSRSCSISAAYKRYNKLLKRCIEKSRQAYYNTLFNDSKNSAFNLWKSLGNVLNPGKKRTFNVIPKLCNNGMIVNDKQMISDVLNEHFCSIGTRLQNQIPHNNDMYKNYLPPPLLNSFYFRPMHHEEVETEISRLNPRKSSGADNIGGKILQLCPHIFAYNLTKIYNRAIEMGDYPQGMKLARVIALYKKGDKHLCDNYRPISLLSCFNKIFEKLICRQLLNFINKYDILYDLQFGFRKKFSTTLALIETVDSIRRLIDQGNYVLGIFVDLTKAFDTVDHEILLYKLDNYGIRGHANIFFKSYLSGRKQFTSANGVDSKLSEINCGVPQGSVLGPILFLLYINDLYRALANATTRLFADDTGVFVSNTNFDELVTCAKTNLSALHLWCQYNKLTMNSSKTCFIIFHAKNKNNHIEIKELEVPNIKINRVKSTKYLGVIFDEKLNWHEHVQSVCKSLLKYFGIFSHIKSIASRAIARQLYFSFIYSRISYGIEVYGNCSFNHLSKLQIIQNKLLKLVLRMDFRTPTNTLHKNLHILKVNDIQKMKILCFVNNCLNENCPTYFTNYFSVRHTVYPLRMESLTVPRVRTALGSCSISVLGARLWNGLPEQIKEKRRQKNFNKYVIKYLMVDYCQDEGL